VERLPDCSAVAEPVEGLADLTRSAAAVMLRDFAE